MSRSEVEVIEVAKRKLLVDRLDTEFKTRVDDYDWSLGIKV